MAVLLAVVALAVIRWVDPAVMLWLESWQTWTVVKLAGWVSFLGQMQMIPLALILGLWIWFEVAGRKEGRIALGATAIAMALGGVMVQLPKFIFGRPRPHFNLPDQFGWFHPEWNSFPSGHATHWFALVGALWVFSPRLSFGVVPMAIIVSCARIVARAHYPSDIIVGAGFGLLFGLFFGLAARSINLGLNRSSRPD